MRPRALLYALLVTVTVSVTAPPAHAQSGADLVAACVEGGGPTSLCYGALHGNLRLAGGACRDATDNTSECTGIDGVEISEPRVASHEKSWLNKALAMQRALDDTRPLQDELWTHTHNSFNADAYDPSISGLDRNHIYKIGDQLRMGIRAIEIDVHWAPSPEGDPADGFNAVLVCHGQGVATPAGTVHVGCGVNDHNLPERLAEIRTFMNANPNEVLMLYLQNELDKNVKAHQIVVAELNKAFGNKIYKPAKNCAPLPMDTSRKQIRDSGARIIITGNCGPGGWGSVVFDRGPRWKEAGTAYGDDFPAFPCTARRKAENYDRNWIRHWGDETGLSAGAGSGGDMTVNDVRNMVRCGVNMVGFDNLVPFDVRLEAMVWSWAKDEPRTTGYCAAQNSAGRFISTPCALTARAFACLNGKTWSVTRARGFFRDGAKLCASEKLGRFSVPWNGWENERLKAAKAKALAKDVWLNYDRTSSAWTPHI
jgi:hypothetical protein